MSGERAQSEVLGTILITAIAVTTVTVIVLAGGPILDATQGNVQAERAADEFALLDRQVSSANLGYSGEKTVTLNTGSGGIRVIPDAGWIAVVHAEEGGLNDTIYNGSLSAVEYRSGDRVVSYQGGGVWAKYGDSRSVMRSSPEFHYRGSTLTMPIINITNALDLSGEQVTVAIDHLGTERVFPSASKRNPIDSGTIYVEIKSTHCTGWADYFTQKLQGSIVEACDEGRTDVVRIRLAAPPDPAFDQAVLATGNLTIAGDSTVDAYDSRFSDYSAANRIPSAGLLIAQGDLTLEHDAVAGTSPTVYGDAFATRNLTVGEEARLKGELNADYDATIESGGCVEGDINVRSVLTNDGANTTAPCGIFNYPPPQPPTLPERDPDPIDGKVATAIDEVGAGGTPLPSSGSTITVTAGDYTITNGNPIVTAWDDADVTLDTRDGPIRIVLIDNGPSVDLTNTDITVVGDNPVEFYVGSSDPGRGLVLENVEVTSVEGRTDVFRVFANASNASNAVPVTITDGSTVSGVIYAPGNHLVTIEDSTLYGAVVAKDATLTDSTLHYDRALRTVVIETGVLNRINYLHITDNRVRIERD